MGWQRGWEMGDVERETIDIKYNNLLLGGYPETLGPGGWLIGRTGGMLRECAQQASVKQMAGYSCWLI